MSDRKIRAWNIVGGIYIKHEDVPMGAQFVRPDDLEPGDLFVVSRDTSGSDSPGPCTRMFVCVRKTYAKPEELDDPFSRKLKYLRYVMTGQQRAYSFHIYHQRKVRFWLVQRAS